MTKKGAVWMMEVIDHYEQAIRQIAEYENLRPATNVPGLKLIEGHRVEVAEHRISGAQVFVSG
jgi:hypothetical protein